MEADDPETHLSEVVGKVRAGIASLFEPDWLDAAVVDDRRVLPPVAGTS